MRAGRIVVVGNGMAGARTVEEIVRQASPGTTVTVFGAEPLRPYNRILLSDVLAGAADPGHIHLHDEAWYARNGVDVRIGVTVTGIDRASREVRSGDGAVTGYDALVLATGSTAIVPPLRGLDPAAPPAGVVPFRTLADCHAILAAANSARCGRARGRPAGAGPRCMPAACGPGRAVVLGGGLLGIEAARGLARRGLSVELIHLAGHLMERQLDEAAGAMLADTLSGLGVTIRTAAQASAVHHDAYGFTAAELADGTRVEGGLLVLACGVRPDVALARDAGLAVEHGVVVDDRLRSVSDPHVFAVGDCAQAAGTVYGLVGPAWEQAAVLAAHLTGADPAARYRGSRLVTRLKAGGIDLAAMGETHALHGAPTPPPDAPTLGHAGAASGRAASDVDADAPSGAGASSRGCGGAASGCVAPGSAGGVAGSGLGSGRVAEVAAQAAGAAERAGEQGGGVGEGDGAEVLCFSDPARGTYKKLVIRDGRLTGAILLGEIGTAGTVTQLFDRGDPVPADRLSLLFGHRGDTPVPAAGPALMPGDAQVCRCNDVTKRAITTAWEAGARDVTAVAGATRATTGCGGCLDTVEGLLGWLNDQETPTPATEGAHP